MVGGGGGRKIGYPAALGLNAIQRARPNGETGGTFSARLIDRRTVGISGTLFADFGTIGKLDDRYLIDSATGLRNPNIVDELSLRAAAGVSIHWRSPMGPIRFDLSKVLSKEDYDKTETFRFSTSTQF